MNFLQKIDALKKLKDFVELKWDDHGPFGLCLASIMVFASNKIDQESYEYISSLLKEERKKNNLTSLEYIWSIDLLQPRIEWIEKQIRENYYIL